MKRLSILIGLFIGLGLQYLPEIGLESAPGQVVTTTHDGAVIVYMIAAVSYVAYVILKSRNGNDRSEKTQTEGGKRLWH